MTEDSTPKKQLETERGGSGRKGKTAVGSGDGGGSDDYQPWPSAEGEPASPDRPRAVVCVNSLLIRFGLKLTIEPMVQVVGDSHDGALALALIRQMRPDMVLLGVDLASPNEVALCKSIKAELPGCNLLVLSDSFSATKYYHQFVRAGVAGFCLKGSSPFILLECIKQLVQSSPYCDPALRSLLKQDPATLTEPLDLSERQTDILLRLSLLNTEIAKELAIPIQCVEEEIGCIFAKLTVPIRTLAISKSVQFGYIPLPKMPSRDPISNITMEQLDAERHARDAINSWLGHNKKTPGKPTLYELLCVDPKAHVTVIRYAYRFLAAKFFPDNEETGDAEMFRRITDAWKILSDEASRAEYDMSLQRHSD